jgi:hypothetical protein
MPKSGFPACACSVTIASSPWRELVRRVLKRADARQDDLFRRARSSALPVTIASAPIIESELLSEKRLPTRSRRSQSYHSTPFVEGISFANAALWRRRRAGAAERLEHRLEDVCEFSPSSCLMCSVTPAVGSGEEKLLYELRVERANFLGRGMFAV